MTIVNAGHTHPHAHDQSCHCVACRPLERPCGCYADRTLASLDKGELQSYRTTGYFNDSARAKALSALDSCKLPRPV